MRLTESACVTADTDTILTSFAWCLACHDGSPEKFPAEIGNGLNLLWHYKWISGVLARSARFPRAQIDAVFADLAVRYDRAGLGKAGILSAQFEDAWTNGRLLEAGQLRRELAAILGDDDTECEACVRGNAIGFLAEAGESERCDRLMAEMLEEDLECYQEPENSLGRMLLPYLRLGQFDNAKRAHLRSYQFTRGNPDEIEIIGKHLEFCAVTGNEARGLAMLERHLAWLSRNSFAQAAHFEMLCSMALLLDAVSRAGFGETAVAGSSNRDLDPFFGSVDRLRTVEQLAAACWAAAAVIGAQFDARNANTHFADRATQFRALANEKYDVPIHSDVFVPAVVSPAEPATPAEWLLLAHNRGCVGEFIGGEAAVRRALDGAAETVRIDVLVVLIRLCVATDRLGEAQELLGQLIGCLRSESRHEEADLEERVGLGMFGRTTDADRHALEVEAATIEAGGVSPDVMARVHLALGALLWSEDRLAEARPLVLRSLATTDERDRTSALRCLAAISWDLDDTDGALEYIEQVLAHPAELGNVADVLKLRAALRAGSGQVAEAITDADEALAICLRLDARRRAYDMCLLSGDLLNRAERFPEAVQRFRFAIRQSKLIDESPLSAEFRYGRALVQSGLGAEACEVLHEVFAAETAAELPAGSRAETLHWLARALVIDEEYDSAVETWQNAIDLFVEADQLLAAAGVGTQAGQLLDRFDQHDEAIKLLTAAVERARTDPGRILSDALHALGIAQANNQQEVGLDTLDEVLAMAREGENDWLFADVTDSRARALQTLGRLGEAAETAANAAGLYAAAGDPDGAARAYLLAARILVKAQRPDESIAAFTTAIELFDGDPQGASAAGLELGDALESLGRLAEAEQARALAES